MGSNSFQYRSCFVFHGLHLHMIYNFAVFWNHLWYYFSPELFQYKSNIKLLFNLKWKVRAENNSNILYTTAFYLAWYISYSFLISFTFVQVTQIQFQFSSWIFQISILLFFACLLMFLMLGPIYGLRIELHLFSIPVTKTQLTGIKLNPQTVVYLHHSRYNDSIEFVH